MCWLDADGGSIVASYFLKGLVVFFIYLDNNLKLLQGVYQLHFIILFSKLGLQLQSKTIRKETNVGETSCPVVKMLNHVFLIFQRVISFLRQLVEHNGFYRSSDQAWVSLERIQFVGACNPPTDPGRKPLAHRLTKQRTQILYPQIPFYNLTF